MPVHCTVDLENQAGNKSAFSVKYDRVRGNGSMVHNCGSCGTTVCNMCGDRMKSYELRFWFQIIFIGIMGMNALIYFTQK